MLTPEWFRSVREEITAHVNGRHWRKHKSDGDRWPSDPHAIDDKGYKLDLFSGEIFLASTGKYVATLPYKELADVYIKLRLTEKKRLRGGRSELAEWIQNAGVRQHHR